MIIHVVERGETINTIAAKYGVSPQRLILENGILYPDRLAVGGTLVIQYPEITYMVQPGDTLASIADKFNISLSQLLRNNPYLSDREYIYSGEIIVISYQGNKNGTIAVNSYAFPFINRDVLKRTLPFLTYLTVYGYMVTDEGEIKNIDDNEVIQITRAYGVAPVMLLTAQSQNVEEEVNVLQSILESEEKQKRFMNNLFAILQTKNYSGVSINTPYILPADRSLYIDTIIKFTELLKREGYKVFDSLSIRIFQLLSGTIFTGVDYTEIDREVDGISLISYSFGYSEGIPPGTVSMDTIRRFIENSIRLIPADKVYFGISVIGYVWKYPYIPNVSKGNALSHEAVIELAVQNNAQIQYDAITNTAYFQYIVDGDEYIVRFWDARSINSFLKLIPEFGLKGISIWNMMDWFPQIWMVINSQYDIEKVSLI